MSTTLGNLSGSKILALDELARGAIKVQTKSKRLLIHFETIQPYSQILRSVHVASENGQAILASTDPTRSPGTDFLRRAAGGEFNGRLTQGAMYWLHSRAPSNTYLTLGAVHFMEAQLGNRQISRQADIGFEVLGNGAYHRAISALIRSHTSIDYEAPVMGFTMRGGNEHFIIAPRKNDTLEGRVSIPDEQLNRQQGVAQENVRHVRLYHSGVRLDIHDSQETLPAAADLRMVDYGVLARYGNEIFKKPAALSRAIIPVPQSQLYAVAPAKAN